MLLLDSFVVTEQPRWSLVIPSSKLGISVLFPPPQVKEGPPLWMPQPMPRVKHFYLVSPNQQNSN